MAGTPEIARRNGMLGGRPKAAHTIQAEKGKAKLIEMYIKNIIPLNQSLIDKALSGDVMAHKEIRDRVHGKSIQPVSGPEGGPIQLQAIIGVQIKKDV